VSRASYLVERGLMRGYSVEICARGVRSRVVSAPGDADSLQRFLALLEPVPEGLPVSKASDGAKVKDLTNNLGPVAEAT